MTVNTSCGALELDEAGEFLELRTAGVRVTRKDAGGIRLETTTGFTLDLQSASPIRATPLERTEPGRWPL